MISKLTSGDKVKLVNVRGSFMSRGVYPAFDSPADAPGEPVAWITPNLKHLNIAHPGEPAIPLYTGKQIDGFASGEWAIPHSPDKPLQWILHASVRYGVKNEKDVPMVKEVIRGVPFDVPHPHHEYTPLYALRRKTKGSIRERFWEWTWEKHIETPLRILLLCGVVNIAFVLAIVAYQQITGHRINWSDIVPVMTAATMMVAVGRMVFSRQLYGVKGGALVGNKAKERATKGSSKWPS